MIEAGGPADVTVVIVSYNTREMTLRAVETLLDNAGDVSMRVVVWDNASHDGSADAIAARFDKAVELVRSAENVGFGLANNAVVESTDTEWVLLLNSDTETLPGAVENLLRFARANPKAGIVGGKTFFADGRLNPTSCWNRMTPWSLFCQAVGLSRVFSGSAFWNPEGLGGWKRDSVRKVDIVTGCLLMLRRSLWLELGGFNPRYFMYGEDNDLCLRCGELGYEPMITPDAQIVHHGGASAVKRESKVVQLMRSKASIIHDHWSKSTMPFGIGMLWLWIAVRRGAAALRGANPSSEAWKAIWSQRNDWLKGY